MIIHMTVYHDENCAQLKGGKTCTCKAEYGPILTTAQWVESQKP